MNGTDGQESMTFEQAFRALETMVTKFETGQLGLDESLALFHEATGLLGFCRQKLAAAEQQVSELMAKLDATAEPPAGPAAGSPAA